MPLSNSNNLLANSTTEIKAFIHNLSIYPLLNGRDSVLLSLNHRFKRLPRHSPLNQVLLAAALGWALVHSLKGLVVVVVVVPALTNSLLGVPEVALVVDVVVILWVDVDAER